MAGNIHRQKKNRDFVTIDTHCLRNKDLRWDAKGLHSYLMQLPDDWKINIADLEKRSLDRHDGTMSPMRALIAAGYVYRERVSGEKGRFIGYDYHLFERPEQTIEWITVNGKSIDGKTVNGKSTTSKYEELVSINHTKEVEEEAKSREAENSETVEEKPEQEREVPPAAAPPTSVTIIDPALPGVKIHETIPGWRPFDIDQQAADLKANQLCRDKFGKDMNMTLAQATEDFPKFVDEFVEDQKVFGTTYNKTSDFRTHFYFWSLTAPKAKAASKAKPAQSTQKPAYGQSTASPVPSNIRRL